MRRAIALDRIYLPRDLTWGRLAASFLAPGVGFYLRGPRILGRAAMVASALLLFSFLFWLGHPAANFAFGLMLSLHATGFVYYCRPVLSGWSLRWRIFFTLATLLAIGVLIYSPLRGAMENHLFVPARRDGQVVVMNRFISPGAIRRGDWVMYSLPEVSTGNLHGGGAVRVQAGYGWGPVLAVAGDRVTFSKKSFAVSGVKHSLLPHMPRDGELIVPEKNWFIWPELDISGHGHVGENTISDAMMRLALVPENRFAGRPFHRWFWREQILP